MARTYLFGDDADGASDPPPVQRQVPVVTEHAGTHAAPGHVGHPAAVVAAAAAARHLIPDGSQGVRQLQCLGGQRQMVTAVSHRVFISHSWYVIFR